MDDANLNGQKECSAYNITKQSKGLKQFNVGELWKHTKQQKEYTRSLRF